MLSVLLLFLVPVGGGIPAGVLLAQSQGIPWPVTAGLYFVSDVILALALEPLLYVFVLLGKRITCLARFGAAVRLAMARTTPRFGGNGAGPVALVAVAFGVDPMTGRTAALAAGHGPVAGWAFAIAGDMLYYALVAASTLGLNEYIKDPDMAMLIILALMMLMPPLIRRIRTWVICPAATHDDTTPGPALSTESSGPEAGV